MGQGRIIGLDVGGAQLKLALVDAGGACMLARTTVCRLWEGLDRLDAALAEAVAGLAPSTVAVTMTGELADLFPDRASGVRALVERLQLGLPGAALRLYTQAGFIDPAAAIAAPAAVASMNWHASATLIAARVADAIVVDVGSTTTDLVPVLGGRVVGTATTDAARLAVGELVYTGLTRTPVMAMATHAPVGGVWRPLMAELFATSADVWRLLGTLDEGADLHPAADGGPKTVPASRRRLARMVGTDAADPADAAWTALADWLAGCQRRRLEDALALVTSARPELATVPLVGLGAGTALVRDLARAGGRAYRDAAPLVQGNAPQNAVAACFPAVAVALLASSRA